MRILVLGLGNDIIADDAAGLIAVRRMRDAWLAACGKPSDGDIPDGDIPDGGIPDGDISDDDIPDGGIPNGDIPDGAILDQQRPDRPPPCGSGPSTIVEFVESSVAGVALLEDLTGHDRALIVDAVMTGRAPPGTIHELRPEDLGAVVAPSPHYAGLPEMLTLAREMELEFPAEVTILGLEVVDPHTIGGPLSTAVSAALPALVERGLACIRAWIAAE